MQKLNRFLLFVGFSSMILLSSCQNNKSVGTPTNSIDVETHRIPDVSKKVSVATEIAPSDAPSKFEHYEFPQWNHFTNLMKSEFPEISTMEGGVTYEISGSMATEPEGVIFIELASEGEDDQHLRDHIYETTKSYINMMFLRGEDRSSYSENEMMGVDEFTEWFGKEQSEAILSMDIGNDYTRNILLNIVFMDAAQQIINSVTWRCEYSGDWADSFREW